VSRQDGGPPWDLTTSRASLRVTACYEIRVGVTWEDGQLVAAGLTGSPYSWAWSASGTAIPFGAVHRPALGARAARDGDLVPLGTRGFASKNSWRLSPLLPPDVRVEIDTAQSPAGPWDGWRPYAPGTYTFWRCRLRVTVRGDGLRFVRIPRLVVVRRKFNRKQEGDVVVGPDADVVVTFPVPFQNAPRVTAHLLGYPGSVEIVSITPTQVVLRPGAAVFAEDPATFAPTIHWQAMGT